MKYLSLLVQVVTLLASFLATKKREKYAERNEQITEDPVDYYNRHYGKLRDPDEVRSSETSDSTSSGVGQSGVDEQK